ncbi:hypothetical protein [Lysobacter gummosus]|uniref:hypothetical protein n=1 Tax=Lysobacter gummosus TaxID=262324 RepID=UPI00362AB047
MVTLAGGVMVAVLFSGLANCAIAGRPARVSTAASNTRTPVRAMRDPARTSRWTDDWLAGVRVVAIFMR